MDLVFSDSARKELSDMHQDMKSIFLLHLEKIQSRPPRKYMKHGIPCHVEKVTRQARIIYDIGEDRMYILHCFTTHKRVRTLVQFLQVISAFIEMAGLYFYTPIYGNLFGFRVYDPEKNVSPCSGIYADISPRGTSPPGQVN